MKTQTRKAVSPIIATLLLIAITVAAGVVVYVFVGGLSANLSKSGGNQVTEQVSLDAYNFQTVTAPVLNLRNTGSGSVTLQSVYFNGALCSGTAGATNPCGAPAFANATPSTCTGTAGGTTASCSAGQTDQLTLTLYAGTAASGASYGIKVVTLDGAIFTFNLIAGSSG